MNKNQNIAVIAIVGGAILLSVFLFSLFIFTASADIPSNNGSYDEVEWTLTAVPDSGDWLHTLTVTGGEPYSKIVPYFYDTYNDANRWIPLFDPNIIPYLTLDGNGELSFVFRSNGDLTQELIKVYGTLNDGSTVELSVFGHLFNRQ